MCYEAVELVIETGGGIGANLSDADEWCAQAQAHIRTLQRDKKPYRQTEKNDIYILVCIFISGLQ